MAGWLETWGLSQNSGQEPMAWAEAFGHAHDEGGDGEEGFAAMPGWVSTDDLARLDAAEGTEAERIYLELMIPHHQGGVEMAEIAVDEAQGPQVRALAGSIVRSQTAEIAVLEQMLDERGGPVA